MKNNKKVASENPDFVESPVPMPEEQNPDFVNMINTKGVVVEIHKDRVDELTKQGFTRA